MRKQASGGLHVVEEFLLVGAFFFVRRAHGSILLHKCGIAEQNLVG